MACSVLYYSYGTYIYTGPGMRMGFSRLRLFQGQFAPSHDLGAFVLGHHHHIRGVVNRDSSWLIAVHLRVQHLGCPPYPIELDSSNMSCLRSSCHHDFLGFSLVKLGLNLSACTV